MSVKQVGAFTFDTETGAISGPAEYMRSDWFAAWKRRFESGGDVVFRQGALGASPDVETALLVSVQTDYAGWRGQQQLNRAVGAA